MPGSYPEEIVSSEIIQSSEDLFPPLKKIFKIYIYIFIINIQFDSDQERNEEMKKNGLSSRERQNGNLLSLTSFIFHLLFPASEGKQGCAFIEY